ncbi:MAG: HD domain-containing protein [Nitrososphaeria archaeon]
MENRTNRKRTREKNTLIKESIKELERHGCNRHIIEHCILVMQISENIINELEDAGVKVDSRAVLKGALLHDIGRARENSVKHGFIGGEILKKEGYEEKVIRIVKNHVGGGISAQEAMKLGLPNEDFIPNSLEEKIVCLADKFVEDNQIRPLEDTLKKFDEILGKGNEATKRTLKIKEEIEHLIKDNLECIIRRN